jgi:hypothetical protein
MKDICIKIEFKRGYEIFEYVVKYYNLKLTENKLSYNLTNNIFEYDKKYYSNDILFIGFSRIDGYPMFMTKNLIINNKKSFLMILEDSFINHNLIIHKVNLITMIEDNIPWLVKKEKIEKKK